eukprot:maker-scaffold_24-snap-gene-1.28-mRNA-1 protein AED:0.04 eAED:0.04 QI:0/0/0.5/1/0/0/2/66/465
MKKFRTLGNSAAALLKQKPASKPMHKLHHADKLAGPSSAVTIRRSLLAQMSPNASSALQNLPETGADFDTQQFYEQIHNVNAENVVSFLPIPIGVAGPLVLDDKEVYVPLATTEGALIASINRGMSAIRKSGGCTSRVFRNGMTRAPVMEFEDVSKAVEFSQWAESEDGIEKLSRIFEKTTRFGKIKGIKCALAGRNVYMRITAHTGDAMGMNMIGKGCDLIVKTLTSGEIEVFGKIKSVALSINVPEAVLKQTLKTNIDDLLKVHVSKNLVGSALAGSLGGNNAHASNIVTALFLATGQDPAQNVESSQCLLHMEKQESGEHGSSLNVSVTLPCIEVGTIGGGTSLKVQASCLKMLGVQGASQVSGDNASKLAEIIAATVLAGELSLNSALASDHLISAHMDLNRKKDDTPKTETIEAQPKPTPPYSFAKYEQTNKRGFGTVAGVAEMYLEYSDQYMDNRLPVP